MFVSTSNALAWLINQIVILACNVTLSVTAMMTCNNLIADLAVPKSWSALPLSLVKPARYQNQTSL